jgi:hypothetical protein
MAWSTVPFGKHKGKTLPQIIFTDPDWFFWAIEENVLLKEPLRREAKIIDTRARVIRIPNNTAGNLEVEYLVHPPTGKFGNMEIVPTSQPLHRGSSPAFRKDVIDLSVPRNIAPYDKFGCKTLVSSAKYVLFGNASTRMTKERCETFFDNPVNFAV